MSENSKKSERVSQLINMKLILLDFEGVLFRGNQAVPNAGRFLTAISSNSGTKIKIVTNSTRFSSKEISDLIFTNFDVRIDEADIVNGKRMMENRIKKDGIKKVYLIGDEKLVKELRSDRINVLTLEDHKDDKIEEIPLDEDVDAVIVAQDFNFWYKKAALATRYVIEKKCKFYVVGNDTRFAWENNEVIPGPYTLSACIKTATFKEPIIIGKPSVDDNELSTKEYNEGIVIGDNQKRDVAFSKKLGAKSVIILTGITKEVAKESKPDEIFNDLGEAIEFLI